jgi:hypothetical protein
VRRHPQHRSFWLLSQPFPHLRFNFFVTSETFATKVEPLYATNTSQHKQEIFLYEYPLHWVLLLTKKLWSSVAHSSSTVAILTTETSLLNMSIRFVYPGYHDSGLCCYLVIHTENLLRPSQLFYFHLWHIYCLSFVLQQSPAIRVTF